MKKRLASLVIGLSVALSLAIPVGAAEMKTPVTEFESVTKEERLSMMWSFCLMRQSRRKI